MEWERRHVAQVWFSDHHIIAENPAATSKERRATMGGRCPVVSAVERMGVEQHAEEAMLRGKGADLTPPCVSSLASPHRPNASAGALEPLRREYI